MTTPVKVIDEIDDALRVAILRTESGKTASEALAEVSFMLDELRAGLLPTLLAHVDRLSAELAEAKEELSTWCSVFPDIAPSSVLPHRSKLEAELAKERARRTADMQAAFDAGFMVSGEGWNGEYPGDAPGTEYYVERRIEALATLTKD